MVRWCAMVNALKKRILILSFHFLPISGFPLLALNHSHLIQHLANLKLEQEAILQKIDFYGRSLPKNTKEQIKRFNDACIELRNKGLLAQNPEVIRAARSLKNTVFLEQRRYIKKNKRRK